MKTEFKMVDRFSGFLSDGEAANTFRVTEVEPALMECSELEFDFAGVTNMTTSFCNALIASLMANHPQEFTQRVRFRNCDPVVRQFIMSAIALGRREATACV